MPVRSTTSLLEAATIYVQSNGYSVLQKRYPALDALRRSKANNFLSINGTQIAVNTSQHGANPWAYIDTGVVAQTTAQAYYNTETDYAKYVMAQVQAPWVITPEQAKLFDEAAQPKKGIIVEQIADDMMKHYFNFCAEKVGGSGGATNQTKTTFGSFNYLLDSANSVGGIAPGTGHAAYNAANWVLSPGNAFALLRIMRNVRSAEPDIWVFSSATGGNDLVGKVDNWLTAAQMRMTDQDRNVGVDARMFCGVPFYELSTLPANEICLLDSSKWCYGLPLAPDKTEKYILPGTAAEAETQFAFGFNVPLVARAHARMTGCQ